MEYEVLWGDGPLGLTLRPDLGEDMPPVVGRITRLDSAAALAKVDVGHMLVSINGMDTARQGYDFVVETLQTIPRPATLRFRVPRVLGPPNIGQSVGSFREPRRHVRGSTASAWSEPGGHPSSSPGRSKREQQYTVVWTEGPLGMILRPDDDDCHVPCIRKITGKGAGTGMERATVGDILVAVNGQETKSLGFRSTITLLKTIRKPAVLKFKRMGRRLSRKRSSQEVPMDGLRGLPKDIGAYDVVWREGDLGLKLKPGVRDIPVLSKLTGKGTASGLQNANVGDELVSVNGTPVEGSAYQDTLRMLKHSPKPAVLRFRPGKNRRESMMSVTSIRSNPATTNEVERAVSHHVPIYDVGRSPARPEQKKRKKRIPLDVAKELVAASQGMELERAMFAGMPILEIEDGSDEAHLLRVQAKLCIQKQTGKVRAGGEGAKEALTQAEREAQVLQEALKKVQDQAKKYEKILETQSRERVLAMATRHKPEEIVVKQNNMIHELAGVIKDLKRESYSDVDVIPAVIEDPDVHRQKIMDDLQNVMSIPVVVPSTKYCADCGVSETQSKLDMDDDGQYYCKDCWENFLSGAGPSSKVTGGDAKDVEETPITPPPVEPVESFSPPPAPEAPTRSMGRLTLESKELEEQQARMEAERKLNEIKELRRSGSMQVVERPSGMTPIDRTKSRRRGLEELAQALLEEEERARAEGNLGLAKKLSAQRSRTMAEASGESTHPTIAASPYASMGNLLGGRDSSEMNGSGSSAGHDDEYSMGGSEAPPPSLNRSVSADSAMKTHSISSTHNSDESPASPPKPTNDYADVNSDEEADDQVVMSDGEDDVLREVEEKNFALAKQLDEAHSVIERARMSIMMSGDETGEEGDDAGLSDEQISLFKKLTSQAEERASMVDRLHPQDDSDSDSDESEMGEEEEDDGVWI